MKQQKNSHVSQISSTKNIYISIIVCHSLVNQNAILILSKYFVLPNHVYPPK